MVESVAAVGVPDGSVVDRADDAVAEPRALSQFLTVAAAFVLVFAERGDAVAGPGRYWVFHSAPRRAWPTGTRAKTSARWAPARTLARAIRRADSGRVMRRGLRFEAVTM